jgi:hypothetical protein
MSAHRMSADIVWIATSCYSHEAGGASNTYRLDIRDRLEYVHGPQSLIVIPGELERGIGRRAIALFFNDFAHFEKK